MKLINLPEKQHRELLEQPGLRKRQLFHTAYEQEIEGLQWSATPLALFLCLLLDPFHLDFHPTILTRRNPLSTSSKIH